MQLKMKQHVFVQMMAVSSYLVSSSNAAEYIVDMRSGTAAATDAILRAMPGVEAINYFPRIEDAVVEMDPETAHRVSQLNGVHHIEESVSNMHVLGWVDSVQPEAGAGRKLAEEIPYGITMVKANASAGGLAPGSSPKKVCVVDTGYDLGHEDLPTAEGFSPYLADDPSQLWSTDGHGHGTHCAGTVGAIGSNNVGVVGVNSNPGDDFFFIGKGLTNSGSGSNAGVMAAVEACYQNGADIISMSLGGGGYSESADAQYKKHYEEDGVLIIAAAGNSGNSGYSYPASYESVMSVAAVDKNENIASFSTYNDQVEIAAPGVGVKSTYKGNDYATMSGTSMACPHVAGVAALVWSHFPMCSAEDIRFALNISARDKGDAGCDDNFGYGIVDAVAAHAWLKTNGCNGGLPSATEGGCKFLPEGPTKPPTVPPPTSAPTAFDCQAPDTTALYSIMIDNYGEETAWEIHDSNNVLKYSGKDYPKNELAEVQMCLSDGSYTFEIADAWGDGICCDSGVGFYKLEANGAVIFEGGDFKKTETVPFVIGESSGSCKSWCSQISIPFTHTDPNAIQKCNFAGNCDACDECTV